MYYFLLNNRFLKRAMGKGACHAVVQLDIRKELVMDFPKI